MANTYKNIVITPYVSNNTYDPKIQFSGANTSTNTDITLYMYPDSNGTISYEGNVGQLFSITNDLSNNLFGVYDVSGIPSIEVYANNLISLAPYGGNVVIGSTGDLVISSGAGIYANGGLGTSGQVLTSNASSIYWSTVSASANVNAQYIWTNTHTFSNTVTFGSNNFSLSNSGSTVNTGFIIAPYNLGVVSSNVTANGSLGNYQYMTANAAFTLTAPSSDTSIDILITNGTGAGTITLSGFTANSTNAGDTYATTSTNKYLLMIRRINSVSTYIWKALQ